MSQIGIINEIGDMSLGFDPLNQNDQNKYDKILEAEQNQQQKNTKNDTNNN